MKRRVKHDLCMIMILGLLLALIPDVQAFAVGRTPKDESYSPYICVYDSESNSYKYIYIEESSGKTEKVKGITYSKKTRTLTLNKYNCPNNILYFNSMGTDIKIKVIGTNSISSIIAFGYKNGIGLSFTGKGTLVINKESKQDYAILVNAEEREGIIAIDESVTIKAYAGAKGSIKIHDTNLSKQKNVIILKNRKALKKVETKKWDNYVNEAYWLYARYPDGTREWIPANAYVVTKPNDDTKYLTYRMPDGDWFIFKDISVDFNGYPEADFVENVGDGQDTEYEQILNGNTYSYTYTKDFILKAKK